MYLNIKVMILYCIITYLMMLGFIIEGENPRDYKVEWIIYALVGPIFIPIILGVFIAESADYMKEQKKGNVWNKKE